jgi:S-adenosylmethionine synthetase
MPKVVESVLAGQPDKVCDQIADALVDEYLRRDPNASVDLHVMGSHGMMMIGGEVRSKADFDISELARRVYQSIGYTDDIEVFTNIDDPSSEMSSAAPFSPSDTAVVHGYATVETRERLPRALVYAHDMARRLDNLRKTDAAFGWLQPDGKVQVMMWKNEVKAVTILASHAKDVELKIVQGALLDRVIVPIVGEGVQIFINPIGPFTIHGFSADSGASGRKLAVDTYGAIIPHGDHALSGKDPMKAERAGAYMARYTARWIVEQELAQSAMVTIAYTMGKSEPLLVKAQGTTEKSRGSRMDLSQVLKREFDFRPEAIVERLELKQPIYQQTAVYGHFGRTGFPWEKK